MTTTHDLPTVAGWWGGADIETRESLGLAADRKQEETQRDRDRASLWLAFRKAGATDGRSARAEQRASAAVDAAIAFTAQSPAPLALIPHRRHARARPNSRTFPARSTSIRTGGAAWTRRQPKFSTRPRLARAARIRCAGAPMTPRATLRLQFHKEFTFADAERHGAVFRAPRASATSTPHRSRPRARARRTAMTSSTRRGSIPSSVARTRCEASSRRCAPRGSA